jgi:sec-independent protein translocase protein TatB
MLDLAWSELALIAVVAVVVIGPKDLPEAVRGVAKGIQKLRRMAGEFQGHVDEVVREAKLEDVRNQINDIRNFDLKGEIERHVDKDGDIRRTFQDDPLRTAFTDTPAHTPPPASPDTTFGPPEPAPPAAATPAPTPAMVEAPAFIPPAFIPPGAASPVPSSPPAGEAPPVTRI